MKNKMNQLFKDKLFLVMMVLGLLTIVAAAGAVKIRKGVILTSRIRTWKSLRLREFLRKTYRRTKPETAAVRKMLRQKPRRPEAQTLPILPMTNQTPQTKEKTVQKQQEPETAPPRL